MNEYKTMYDGAVVTVPMPAVKEKPTFTRAERITAALMLLAGFLWVRLGMYHASGIFTSLLDCGILTAMAAFLRLRGVKFTRSETLALVVLYAFSFVYTVTANEFLKVLDTLFLMMVGALWLFHTANPNGDVLRYLPVTLGKGLIAAPFRNLTAAPLAIGSGAKSGGFWKNTGYILLGLVLAVPVTGIAGALLYEADDNMARIMDHLLQLPSEEVLRVIPHLLIGLPLGAMFFSALYTAAHKGQTIDHAACNDAVKSCRFVPTPLLYACVTPLCGLYLLFFFSQMQYFLGGFTGSTVGMTYAEYARRGFFELCGVCCMNLLVIGGIGFFAVRKNDRRPALLKIYGCFLCVSSLLLAGTAIAKMLLYIRVYGMTQLRVYTTWFMLLLVLFFGVLLVRQFRETLNIGKIMSVGFTVMFALLCFSRPDAWMIRYNADHYLSGQLEDFDSSVLYDMSEDAWSALTAYDEATVRTLLAGSHAAADFEMYTTRRFEGEYDFWEQTNLSAWELMLYRGQ